MSENFKLKSFFLFFFFLSLIIFISNMVSAAVFTNNYKFTLDVSQDTLTQDMEITSNQAPGVYYTYLTTDYLSSEILSWKQTGGKTCKSIEAVKANVDGMDYTYIKCDYDPNVFLPGDSVTLQVVTKCNCTYKNGIDLFVYPSDHRFSADSTGSIENIIYVPSGYYFFNSSLPGATFKELNNNLVVSLKQNLVENQSLYDIYGQRFVHFKKKVDFLKIKQLIKGKLTLNYPSGFEPEAQDLFDNLTKLLPAFEKYAGDGVTYDNITVRLVENNTVLDGYCGMAYQAYNNPDNKDAVNVSITCSSGNTPFHELCHLSEKPFIFPSWFAEGEATNCGEVKLMTLLGRLKEAKDGDEARINSSNLVASIPDLGTWLPANTTNDTDNYTLKGYGLAYSLFKELLFHVDIAKFYSKARVDFKNYNYMLPNDAIICEMNKVATSDLIPIFKKYGFDTSFNTSACGEDPYYFLNGRIFVYRSGNWSDEVKQGELWLLKDNAVSSLNPGDLVALKEKGDLYLLSGGTILWLKNNVVSVLSKDEVYVYKDKNGSLLIPADQSSLLKEGNILKLSKSDSSKVRDGIVLLSINGTLTVATDKNLIRLAGGDWSLLKQGKIYLFKEKVAQNTSMVNSTIAVPTTTTNYTDIVSNSTNCSDPANCATPVETSTFSIIIGIILLIIIFIGIPAAIIYGIYRLVKKLRKK